MINRFFVEKKADFSNNEQIKNDINSQLKLRIASLRKFIRYDMDKINDKDLDAIVNSVLSEPPLDNVYNDISQFQNESSTLIVEYLKGQYDQRADSAAQCIQLLTGSDRPLVKCATIYVFNKLTADEMAKVKKYLINPVEACEGTDEIPTSLEGTDNYSYKDDEICGFIDFDKDSLQRYYDSFGFALNFEDLQFVQEYYIKQRRNPTLTELKVIDTYWSDHCRHTTFLTQIEDVKINSNIPELDKSYQNYCKIFDELNANKPHKYHCLMDIATIAAKKLKIEGYLDNLDESDEINACSVKVMVDVDGKDEEWLIMFKNETHNHPTEIEPFGGAATCLGGAIRDPLSGRTYVYQAMRITGAADPRTPYDETLKGKLPQKVLSKTAANGFSSYGNQIGLATGIVHEIYDDGFKAKRLETGYVIGGAPSKNVIRKKPETGDVVILLGGATGRDGCGGATGSSKSHTIKSVELCGAEVQKGNAPEERKLQRLFRNKDAAQMIIKCNDFGAGGVCVAIGELADGLDIYLDKVPKKYNGLTPTELAISESQERMAVIVKPCDVEEFIKLANSENLNATVVAYVTEAPVLKMYYEGHVVAQIEREFLDTNGVKQLRNIEIVDNYNNFFNNINPIVKDEVDSGHFISALNKTLSSLNCCSQKGLGEYFDSTIGASSMLMPFGGKYQLTPSISMAAKPPVGDAYTSTVTVSTYGVFIDLLKHSPYLGAIYSVVGAMAKQIASGVDTNTIRLTMQEFFKKLNKDAQRWGEPMSALLGAFDAQLGLKIAAIGGKDSMSGSFENYDVPPTLICFACGITKEQHLITNVFNSNGYVYQLHISKSSTGVPYYDKLLDQYSQLTKAIKSGKIIAATVIENGGALSTIAKSLMGNKVGIELDYLDKTLFMPDYADIIFVTNEMCDFISEAKCLGKLNDSGSITCKDIKVELDELINSFVTPLEKIYPTKTEVSGICKASNYTTDILYHSKNNIAKPRVFIPVFPGTNCEFDTIRAFNRNGAVAKAYVINNQNSLNIKDSIKNMVSMIKNSQIIAFPGGFSGGDEPDGSGKFILNTFKNPYLQDAVNDLLHNRDGLAIGICNGFQALIKLGLVPNGEIVGQNENSETLSFNDIRRHISSIVRIRIGTNKSPWLSSFKPGEIYSVPISHGEGKFICSQNDFDKLLANGQIATQYVDLNDNVTMNSPYNPNGSVGAIEGIISVDGRVLGKMGHTERCIDDLYKNVDGSYHMNIFKNGVKYYK